VTPFLVIGGCLLASAFFSSAEMAFVAANRIRLRHLAEEGNRIARRYLEAFHRPARVFSTAMIGTALVHIIASAVATWWLLPRLGPIVAPLLVTLALTPLMLVFGVILPKAVARQWSTGLILRLYPLLEAASWLLAPLAWGSAGLVELVLRGLRGRAEGTRAFVSREELRLLLQVEPHEVSDVKEEEREMIDKIFELGETPVRAVMVPLVDVAALPEEATVEEAVAVIRERGYSRLPVYRERVDHVVGVVTALDILRRGDGGEGIKALLRPAFYVPETKRIDDLLREMQRQRVQLAVVVDEYGGSVGIVTVEDIVEEIVGEIEDEHDRRSPSIEPLPDGSYLVAARVGIDELNETLGWELPKRDYETVGGLLLSALHRIPRPGEEVDIPGYHLTVVDADERRILKVKVTPRRSAVPGGAPARGGPA